MVPVTPASSVIPTPHFVIIATPFVIPAKAGMWIHI